LNPVTAGIATGDATWGNNAAVWNNPRRDPTNVWPGTLGTLIFYTGQTGPFKQSQKGTIDQGLLESMYAQRRAAFADFNGKIGKFNTDRDNFNTANKNEKARKADFFKATFEPAIVVPSRPCPPTLAPAWGNLLQTDLAAARGSTWAFPATFTVSSVD
jgi:hypothetical protein